MAEQGVSSKNAKVEVRPLFQLPAGNGTMGGFSYDFLQELVNWAPLPKKFHSHLATVLAEFEIPRTSENQILPDRLKQSRKRPAAEAFRAQKAHHAAAAKATEAMYKPDEDKDFCLPDEKVPLPPDYPKLHRCLLCHKEQSMAQYVYGKAGCASCAEDLFAPGDLEDDDLFASLAAPTRMRCSSPVPSLLNNASTTPPLTQPDTEFEHRAWALNEHLCEEVKEE